MSRAKDSRIGLTLVAVGVLFIALFAFTGPVQAHEMDGPSMEAFETQIEIDHSAHCHMSHCHGDAFCPGVAIISLAISMPQPIFDPARYGFPEIAQRAPASSSFDPPPPRTLI